MKKTIKTTTVPYWCKHIGWYHNILDFPKSKGFWTVNYDINGLSEVPKWFKFCPVCGEPRPKNL